MYKLAAILILFWKHLYLSYRAPQTVVTAVLFLINSYSLVYCETDTFNIGGLITFTVFRERVSAAACSAEYYMPHRDACVKRTTT